MAKKAGSRLEKAEETIRVMRVKNGDIIVVRKWPGFTDGDREKLSSALSRRLKNLTGVTLLFVGSFSDIRILNTEQMEKIGWVRKGRAR